MTEINTAILAGIHISKFINLLMQVFLLNLDVLKAIVWPITFFVLILIILFVVRKELISLLGRIKRFKYGDAVAELSQSKSLKGNLENQLNNESEKNTKTLRADEVLSIFHSTTLEKFKAWVDSESKINDTQNVNEQLDRMVKYSQALYMILVFERLYIQIFGSQIFILESLNTEIQTKAELKRFYDSAVEMNPEYFKNYSYDEYFQFLIKWDLVSLNVDGSCLITWMGRDFLKWTIETGRSLVKMY